MPWTDIKQQQKYIQAYFPPPPSLNILHISNNSTIFDSLRLQLENHSYIEELAKRRPTSCNSVTEEEDEVKHAAMVISSPPHQGSTSNKRKATSIIECTAEDDDTTDAAKRKDFLEKSWQAALKCRLRKKLWLNKIQERMEYLINDNGELQLEAKIMRDDVYKLRQLLLAHSSRP